ncbi:hypothetical protein V8C35DRAFT_330726 [Trichoderma chlorosporum]
MAQLSDLPVYVRRRILAYVDTSAPKNLVSFPSQCRRSELGLYVSVCREWQLFFEQRLYAHLVLTQNCLASFSKLTPRQSRLVRYIWLRISLENYTCLRCQSPQVRGQSFKHSSAFTESIFRFFCILNAWDASQEKELTLEISVYSPSDVNHAVKGDIYLNSDSIEMEDMVPEKGFLVDDPDHGWKDGKLMEKHNRADICDTRGHLIFASLQAPMPLSVSTARVVTRLVIRRTTRRFITNCAIKEMLWRLPNLRHFTYEHWGPVSRFGQAYMYCNTDNQRIFSKCLPKTLKTINWFEDFNEEINRIYYEDVSSSELLRISSARQAASSGLAHRSVWLEQVTGCYSVDAVPFFKAARVLWTWSVLTTLSLTCTLFTKPERQDEIVALLARIGMVAQGMSQLQTLDIWDGRRHHAAAFRHRVTDGIITISWRGTWELNLGAKEQEIIALKWQDLARVQGKRSLYIGTYRPVESKDVTSHAAAIRLLEIDQNVIHPASLEEISRETKYYYPS